MSTKRDSACGTRIAAVQKGLETNGAAVAVFGLSTNLRYLMGFTDEPGERALLLIVPVSGEPTMVVPALYVDQVDALQPPAAIRSWADGEDPMDVVREIAEELTGSTGRVLVDDTLWAMFVLPIRQAFPGRSFGLASEVVTSLRMRKAAGEVAAMRRAGEIADLAFEDALAEPVAGCTESELAGRLEAAMLAHGAESVAFETLVASGPNSALPHYRAGTRRIEDGDIVILDYGCRVDGYCSDISRTVVCGRPSAEMERVHDAVRRAHWAARKRVAVGVPAEEVDAAARDVLTAAGYGDRFVHRTGHGIGLDVHEPPYIVAGNGERLKEGMAFSIEPGAYFGGDFGVRIEDVVVVGESGAAPMTEAPQALRRVM